jgi:hypothetical protein
MWLPHGLADNTTALQALSGQISICPIRSSLGLPIIQCRPMAFTLTRPTRGTLVMSVPGIQPLTQYRVTIAASDAVGEGWAGVGRGTGLLLSSNLRPASPHNTQT